MDNASALHVAAGVISGRDGRILITQRAKHSHQGGLWEFPGGKLEDGESAMQALCRELREEVGIEVQRASPLIRINYRYPDRHVLLDVWRVDKFAGTAFGREGQAMRWVESERLVDYAFPAANLPIIAAARLPRHYAILEGSSPAEVMNNLERILDQGIGLIQLRVKSLPSADLNGVYSLVSTACRQRAARLLINADLGLAAGADGIHLSSRALLSCRARPEASSWVAASCHDLAELRHAEKIGVDFAVLAPVLPTSTHPGAVALGWENFAALSEQVNLPVFALGGLERDDLDKAAAAGAQGIAGISAFLTRA